MTMTADVVVVGLGAMGSATLHRLAMAGVSAVGVDRFDPPHTLGSTHGDSRITRLAIAEGGAYVPLVRRSHELWRELEAQTGDTFLLQTGGLFIGTGDGGPSHGQAGFLGSTIKVADECGVPYEILPAAEIRRRFPQFAVRDGERGYWEPSAGVVFPEKAVATQLRLARELGATVRTNETVLSVLPCGSGVAVTTDKGRIEAARAVLTAGAWLPGLAGGKLQANSGVHRQVVMWFEADEPALYDPARCPVYIWMHGDTEEDYLYGFPQLPDKPGVKVGSERYGDGSLDPNAVNRDVPETEWRDLYGRHVAGRLRGVTDRLLRSSTCLYTVTKDAGFVVDSLAGDGAVLVASACSGHGFKHSPAMGEHLAQLATGDAMRPHEHWGLARFAA